MKFLGNHASALWSMIVPPDRKITSPFVLCSSSFASCFMLFDGFPEQCNLTILLVFQRFWICTTRVSQTPLRPTFITSFISCPIFIILLRYSSDKARLWSSFPSGEQTTLHPCPEFDARYCRGIVTCLSTCMNLFGTLQNMFSLKLLFRFLVVSAELSNGRRYGRSTSLAVHSTVLSTISYIYSIRSMVTVEFFILNSSNTQNVGILVRHMPFWRKRSCDLPYGGRWRYSLWQTQTSDIRAGERRRTPSVFRRIFKG